MSHTKDSRDDKKRNKKPNEHQKNKKAKVKERKEHVRSVVADANSSQ